MIFNRIQVRCASVLASLPPSPHSSSHCIHQTQQHIITPASLPITATSNNAFNPNYIPKNTKERLTLGELYKVLDNSKSMYKMIQNEYLKDDELLPLDEADQELSLEELLEEQYKLIQLLKKKWISHTVRKRDGIIVIIIIKKVIRLFSSYSKFIFKGANFIRLYAHWQTRKRWCYHKVIHDVAVQIIILLVCMKVSWLMIKIRIQCVWGLSWRFKFQNNNCIKPGYFDKHQPSFKEC